MYPELPCLMLNVPRRNARIRLSIFAAALALFLPMPSNQIAQAQNWPSWRGPNNLGVSSSNPPIDWSRTKNIRWQTAVPGRGHSTPIIWGNQVFLLTAIPADDPSTKTSNKGGDLENTRQQPSAPPRGLPSRIQSPAWADFRNPRHEKDAQQKLEFTVLSFDRSTGIENWRTVLACAVPHERGHPTNSFASGSPVTNGLQLFISFGSHGIFCLSLDGKVIWKRQLGQMRTRNGFGEANTPALLGEVLVVPWDHEEQSMVSALNTKTGQTLWETQRDEPTTWSTPLIVHSHPIPQVILNGTSVTSYRLSDGKPLWTSSGQATNPIASPMKWGDLVFCMTGYRGYVMQAIDLTSSPQKESPINGQPGNGQPGNGKPADLRWIRDDTGPYVSSPTLCRGNLFVTKGLSGVLSVFDAQTGVPLLDQRRIKGLSTLYASPLGIDPNDPASPGIPKVNTKPMRVESSNRVKIPTGQPENPRLPLKVKPASKTPLHDPEAIPKSELATTTVLSSHKKVSEPKQENTATSRHRPEEQGDELSQQNLSIEKRSKTVQAENSIARVYFCSRDGTTVVINASPPFEILARNELGEPIDASPVASDQQLFIRTSRHLYCIQNRKSEPDPTEK